MFNTDLVLEGGGMRGMFTAGVLDAFMEEDISFKRCIGVSAGACHACSFMSRQKKRAYNVGVDYLDNKRYCSFFSLITTGDLFGAKFVYDEIPNKLNLYDYDAFNKNETEFYATVTNCETGKAEYIKINDMKRDIVYVRASSSLPLLARIVKIGEKKYLDGGIADSIPVRHSLSSGNGKCVVVLTQHKGYRKKPNRLMALMRIKYFKYPLLTEKMENRYKNYNDTLDFLEEEEKKGSVYVIRPPKELEIGRIEKDKEVLKEIYETGYNEAKRVLGELKTFLENDRT